MSEAEKMIGLKIEDLKKITCAEIDFNGKTFVKIKGGPEAGKTTVLQSLSYLFDGKSIPSGVVQNGKEKAIIEGEFSNHYAKRIIKVGGKSTLVVKTKGGAKIDSPQSFLDGLTGRFIDPIKMMDMKDAALLETLLNNSGVNIESNDKKIKDLETERTLLSREIKSLGEPKKAEKTKILSVKELIEDRKKAQDYIEKITEIKKCKEKIKLLTAEILTADEIYEDSALSEIDEKIENIEEHNIKAIEYDKYLDHKKKHEGLIKKRETKSSEVDAERQAKKDKIKEIALPANIEIKENQFYINDVTRENWSTSQSITAHVDLALMLSKELKLLLIDRAESLGVERTEMLVRIAKEKGVQIVASFVDETYKLDGDSIFFQEGDIFNG